MDKKGIYFKDVAKYDAKTKRVILCRDGVSEYMGIELGISNDTKTYRVFKPKSFVDFVNDTINELGAIPIFIDHIKDFADLSDDIYYKKGGVGKTRTDFINNNNICEGKIVAISEDVKDLLKKGREVSLGYKAYIKASNDSAYDFIHDIYEVNHLAIAPDGVRGRCGSMCSVLDIKEEGYKKFILNELSEDSEGDKMNEKELKELRDSIKKGIMEDLDKKAKEAKDNKDKEDKDKSDKSDKPDDDKDKKDKKPKDDDMKDAEKKAYDKGYKDACEKFGKKVSDTYQNALKLASVGFLEIKDLIDKKPCEVMLDQAKKVFGNEDIKDDTLQPYVDMAIKKGNEKSWDLTEIKDLNKEDDKKKDDAKKKEEDKVKDTKKSKTSIIDINSQ